jgi:hypothetical protein
MKVINRNEIRNFIKAYPFCCTKTWCWEKWSSICLMLSMGYTEPVRTTTNFPGQLLVWDANRRFNFNLVNSLLSETCGHRIPFEYLLNTFCVKRAWNNLKWTHRTVAILIYSALVFERRSIRISGRTLTGLRVSVVFSVRPGKYWDSTSARSRSPATSSWVILSSDTVLSGHWPSLNDQPK